jgi:hypothetical protein
MGKLQKFKAYNVTPVGRDLILPNYGKPHSQVTSEQLRMARFIVKKVNL